MKHINPKNVSINDIQKYLNGGIAPRPIALVSTISEYGENNLSPFSFYNAFGSNPPTIAFSPSRRVRDGSLKDTYYNLISTKQCVVQAVTYDMVEQMSLSSTEYEPYVDEFVKSGFTPIDSMIVKPKRVKESPFQMECKLLDMIPLGKSNGAGNLAICEVVYFHIDDDIFENGIIQPSLIDLVGRNSGDFYTRASGNAIFEVEKPLNKKGIGYDKIPKFIKDSHIFSANNLGKFGNSESIPNEEEVFDFIDKLNYFESTEQMFERFHSQKNHKKMLESALFLLKTRNKKAKLFIELSAKIALENNDLDFAWKSVLYSNFI